MAGVAGPARSYFRGSRRAGWREPVIRGGRYGGRSSSSWRTGRTLRKSPALRRGLIFTTRDFRSPALEKTHVFSPKRPQTLGSFTPVAKVGLAPFSPGQRRFAPCSALLRPFD